MNAPKLRFKDDDEREFPDWEEAIIGDIISQKPKKYNPDKSESSFKCVELEHLSQETGELLGFADSRYQKSIKNKFQKGEVLFGKLRPYLKKYLKAPFEGVCSTEIWVLTGKKVSNDFVYQLVQTENFITLTNISSGSKMPRAEWSVVASGEIKYPSFSEQTKIANFLTAIDEKISELTQKCDLLKQYKKGVMQQIFSQKLRFKDEDGREFPEWEEMPLSKFLIPIARKVLKPEGQYLAVGIRSHFKGTFQRPNSESEKIAMDVLYEVKPNDLIVNITFAWEGAVAIAKDEDAGGLVSHRFPTFEFNEQYVKSNFFKYVYPTNQFKYLLDLNSPGGAGRNRVLNKNDFLKIECLIPCVAEQTKIANFLTAIDDKITHTKTQLDAVKLYKKGLLQQLFV